MSNRWIESDSGAVSIFLSGAITEEEVGIGKSVGKLSSHLRIAKTNSSPGLLARKNPTNIVFISFYCSYLSLFQSHSTHDANFKSIEVISVSVR